MTTNIHNFQSTDLTDAVGDLILNNKIQKRTKTRKQIARWLMVVVAILAFFILFIKEALAL